MLDGLSHIDIFGLSKESQTHCLWGLRPLVEIRVGFVKQLNTRNNSTLQLS